VQNGGVAVDARHPSSEDSPSTGSPVSDRLDSWKSVASFLHRDIRTVQRWEAQEGLPIYRHQGSQHSPIHAYKSEIETWWKARQSTLNQRLPKASNPSRPRSRWLKISYPQLAIFAVLVIVLAFSLTKAKQMFLRPDHASSITAAVPRLTIAVLPFQSSTDTSEDSNVALNITEELIGDCGRSKTLRVIDQSLVMPFEGSTDSNQHIAQLLHSDKLLRGTAGRSGKSIYVTARLIDSATGNAIWSQQFESNDEDLLESEKKIANAITTKVEIALASQPRADVGNAGEPSLH
jgi:TolB-like protein